MPAAWRPERVQVGEWRITALLDGTMRLDGGAMWGVVPKTLWARLTPPAEDNTIELALRPFLLERGDWKVVLEPGIGGHLEEKWRRIYALDRRTTLAFSLHALGLGPGDITHVVASHCHFDHIGGWLTRDAAEELAPLFPRAEHRAPAVEIEAAKSPDPARKGGYSPTNVRVIERAGLLRSYARDEELLPGLVAHEAAGHSDGVSVITVNEHGPGETAIFWADIVPTSHHVQPAYIMAYDLDVPRSYASRSKWLARAADEGWLGLFYHDSEHAFGRVTRASERYAFEALEGERQ
ncbi:MAG: MBL fold metallo-hydrolase [Planctomycetes bacterium]|nr:MBL fold metallo-hydrolase [Planctomycetota bacterium]